MLIFKNRFDKVTGFDRENFNDLDWECDFTYPTHQWLTDYFAMGLSDVVGELSNVRCRKVNNKKMRFSAVDASGEVWVAFVFINKLGRFDIYLTDGKADDMKQSTTDVRAAAKAMAARLNREAVK